MADLVGIQISGLQTTPSLSSNTEFPLQRQGISKAEKVTLNTMLNWIMSNNVYLSNVNQVVNAEVGLHVNGTDPHGDRAYANSILTNHLAVTDPHGDRAFATNAITTAINTHISGGSDPHGDRLFTTNSISTHAAASDPHGDRAFATNAINTSLTSANNYTDTKVNSEFTSRIGASIAPLTSGKVPNSYLNLQVIFAEKTAFPSIGSTSVLYYDTTGNDIYKWTGSVYLNVTPAVDISNLDITTDDVVAGSNVDRQYLTSAKEASFNSKLGGIVNETSSESFGLYSRVQGTSAYLKNIKLDYPLAGESTNTDVIISDNNYNYAVMNEDVTSTLIHTSYLKTDALLNYDTNKVYELKGDVICFSGVNAGDKRLINKFEKFTVDAVLGNIGITEDLPVVVSANFSSDGLTITGEGYPEGDVAIYDKSYSFVGVAGADVDGLFTYTFTEAQVVGDEFYLHNTFEDGGSEGIKIFSPKTGTLITPTNLSVSVAGDTLHGKADRGTTVVVKNIADVDLGSGAVDVNGFFNITLTPPVVSTDIIKISSTNTFGGASTAIDYTVPLGTIEAPYDIIFSHDRTLITGKAVIGSTVTIKDGTDELVGTAVSDSAGNFSIVVAEPDLIGNTYNATATVDLETSEAVIITLPSHYVIGSPPTVVPILSSEAFSFLHKEIVKKSTNSDFDFNIVINTETLSIDLVATNNLGETVTWDANIKINTINI